jgi:transcriptional regulator with XRE-family HTH domain
MDRGERVRRLRVAKGWKLKNLGAAVKALDGPGSTSNVSKAETGNRGPVPAATYDLYAQALDVPSETILTGLDDAAIVKDAIGLARRHSLAKMISKHSIPDDEAAALRKVEQNVRWGPLTLRDWEHLRAYGIAYLELRKPAAKAEPRSARAKDRRADIG